MPLPIIGLAKAVTVAAIDTTVALVSLPARVIGLVGAAESLVERITEVVERAERLVVEVEAVAATAGVVVVDAGKISNQASGVIAVAEQVSSQAAGVVAVAEHVSGKAAGVVDNAAKVSGEAAAVIALAENTAAIANELIRVYEPIALRAAPLAGRFVTELSEEEVDAAIRLVDELPQLTEHLTTNILPILGTLDRVGPDVTELLKVTRDVRRAIVGIPGFGFFRRRGAERIGEPDEDNITES
ncbi:hypothetical protein [Kutzneria kofuensis]|uniref:Ribulose 1,5-bisphosphate carboxylase large subunit n=1 Tax=Kutzneria kofuensis TaxID=103725 RepID=A0A7W9NFS9_9PSEU|nr:hypothetical protein [Kutzneria kofuensis]MBB5890333.1 hypothetical protein [Kutzneria kofuensis]